MLQNTCPTYGLLYIFEETRARCVLAGDGHVWRRSGPCKRLVKGPTRPRLWRIRCAPESSVKNSVLNSERSLRQVKAEIIAYCNVWELHLNTRTYGDRIAVGAIAAVLGRELSSYFHGRSFNSNLVSSLNRTRDANATVYTSTKFDSFLHARRRIFPQLV